LVVGALSSINKIVALLFPDHLLERNVPKFKRMSFRIEKFCKLGIDIFVRQK